MIPPLPEPLAVLAPPLGTVFAAALGAIAGSFANAAIHRLPEPDLTLTNPRRSRCPNCARELTWRENVPLLSWLAQRGRCRGCGWRIPVRYPLVELLTAGLFVWALHATGPDSPALFAVRCLVLLGLVIATFVDLDRFEIPDEVSIGGMVLAPVAALAVPGLHDATWVAQRLTEGWQPGLPVDRFGALAAALAGEVAGGGLLLAIGWIASRAYGREAMGFGDVKLLAAGGGFVGPGGALAALLIGSVLASVAGVAGVVRFTCLVRRRARARGSRRPFGEALAVGRVAGRYLPFGPHLGMGIGITLLAWEHVAGLMG